MTKKYVDSAMTLEVLKQDSGLLPIPQPGWHTFIPQVNDLAWVYEDSSEYIFNGVEWVKHIEPEEPKEETSVKLSPRQAFIEKLKQGVEKYKNK